jgi:rhodanese-related sulfurtransferase
MKRKFLKKVKTLVLLGICAAFGACGQIPEDRPYCEDTTFDGKVSRTISFSVPVIGVEELAQKKDQYLLLDAREKKEYQVSHIEGARYIGYNNFSIDQIADIPKDQPVVLYCSIGYRSEKIGEQLKEAGYTNVQNLFGSIFEWVNQGYPVVGEQQKPTEQVHTYNRNWSKWVLNPEIEKTW